MTRYFLFLLTALIIGCGSPDWETKLDNDLRLVRTSAYTVFIYRRVDGSGDKVLVPPNIVAIGQQAHLLIGRVETNSTTVDFEAKPGWFLLDISTGDSTLGLSEIQLQDRLGQEAAKVKIVKPGRFRPASMGEK